MGAAECRLGFLGRGLARIGAPAGECPTWGAFERAIRGRMHVQMRRGGGTERSAAGQCGGGRAPPTVVATPTALYQQPEGRRNLVRITVTGLAAPAGRARVTDRRGALVGSAGLLPSGPAFLGEVWVPLSEPSQFQIDVEALLHAAADQVDQPQDVARRGARVGDDVIGVPLTHLGAGG